MKKFLLFFCLALFMSCAVKKLSLPAQDAFIMSVGEDVNVTLEAGVSDGCEWVLKNKDSLKKLVFVKDEYITVAASENFSAESRQQTFTFKKASGASGREVLIFWYMKSSEKNSKPFKEKAFTVGI